MAIWTQTYALTPEEYQHKCQELASSGVSISGPSGTIERNLPLWNHMIVNYSYDGSSLLTVDLVECTAFSSEVEAKLNQWFTNTGE